LDLVAPVPFSLVCFRHKGGNEPTRSLADAINRSGHSYVTPSSVDDMSFIRVSIGQTKTDEEHIDRLWELVAANA
jgi:aromatic-L-amino-acid decarboxylase